MTRGRQLLLATLLVTAGLAGCVGSDDAPVGPAKTSNTTADEAPNASVPTFPNGTPAPTTLTFRDCYEHLGVVPVPASAYADRLPAGFSLASYAGEPSGTSAALEVVGEACDRPDGTRISTVTTALLVDPPDAWENENAFGHGLVLSWVTTSEHHARVNEAWGFGDVAETGDVSLEETRTPAARQGTLQVSAGETTLRLETLAGGQPGQEDGNESRLFALGADGTVTGAKDVNWTSVEAVFGSGVVSGSADAGLPHLVPAATGLAGHIWGWDATVTYVDLPPRGDS